MIVNFRRNPPPPPSPPTHHHGQHCDCSGVIQITGHHHLPGPEVGQSHRIHCKKGPAEDVLLPPAEELQPSTGAAENVYSAIIESVLCTSITSWFSSATKSDYRRLQRVVRTAERIIGTTLPIPRTVFIQSEKKGWKNHSGPLTSSTLPLWTVTVWSMLQSSEHQNSQTQKQFLASGNPSHEHLTITMVHTLFIHAFILHTYLVYTSIADNIPVHTKLSIVIYLYIQLSIFILLFLIYLFFLILLFIICVFVLSLSFCCTAVASVMKTIPRMRKHTWQ